MTHLDGESTNKFKTKTGYCHVDGDTIRLTHRSGRNLRTMYEGIVKRGTLRRRLGILSLYIAFFAGLGWFVMTFPWAGSVFAIVILGGLAVDRYRTQKYNFTSDQEIPLDAIDTVTAREGSPILTRPRFIVRYTIDSEQKRRYILLPSSLYAGSKTAYETGKRLLRRNGIEVAETSGLL